MNNRLPELPSDRVHIRDLMLRCIVGIYPEERENLQDVIINITIHGDLSRPCRSDDISETIDYKRIKKAVVALVENSSFYLIERMAQAIADCCLGFEGVERVDVTVDKPGALRFARSVAVEISRARSGDSTENKA
ncbi:MAG TPA: dihydroneopterin aldolase [Candidatus Hydrogenedentes bacterium]|nr:dihydroneopterin aldolase [Candidatus Hydrogenedentota bacterium]